MMHVIILGDSWGDPNWRGPQYQDRHSPRCTVQGHTANRLVKLGYTVFNYSQSGQGNTATWLKLEADPPQQADHIIWFHTEIARDMSHQSQGDLYKELDKTADQVYEMCSRIQAQHVKGVPMTVIESQSQCHQPLFDHYFPQAQIYQDWRAQLLSKIWLPYTPLLTQFCSQKDPLGRWSNSLEQKNQWLTDAEQVLDLMKHSDLFPDNCHPGDLAHQQLTERLISDWRAN